MVKMKATSTIRFYRSALNGLLAICIAESVPDTKASQEEGLIPSGYLVTSLPLVRNSLQSEVCITHPAITVLLWKSSQYSP